MASINNYKPTFWLIEQIDIAIHELAPYFDISNNELMKFEKPTITRLVDASRYGSSPDFPAYHPEFNLVFFPWKNYDYKYLKPYDSFQPDIIHHEAGHYLHNSINPAFKDNFSIFSKNDSMLRKYSNVKECVAEYGNYILGLSNRKRKKTYADIGVPQTFAYHGPGFLPELARMSLEEAIKKDVPIGLGKLS
jgi:hypothetical protein